MMMKRMIAALMVLPMASMFTLGCGGPVDPERPAEEVRSEKAALFDGETLFKGMFLGLGPAARMFPEVWEHPKVVARMSQARRAPQQMEESLGKLMGLIKEKDPSFFERFGRDIQSGDHLAIQAMLTESKTVLQETLASFNGNNEGEVKPQMMDSWYYRYEWAMLDIYAVGYVAVVAVIAVIDFNVAPTDTQASSVRDDSWVDMIARKNLTRPLI